MPRIITADARFPERYFSQGDVAAEFLRVAGGRGEITSERVSRLFTNVGVSGRHMVLPLEAYPRLGGFAERSGLWLTHALELGTEAVRGALARAGLAAGDIGLFTSVTVTGLAVPPLDSRIMGRLGFSPGCRRLPLFGLGCVGGAAGLARVSEYLRARPGDAAVLLCVELCSLTFQLADTSVANIVAAALFGDGAACVVMVGDEHPLARTATGPRVGATQSVLFPGTERLMGWDIIDSGFRIVLSGSVPDLARGPFAAAARAFLGERQLTPADVATWVAHPGGPAVIEAVSQSLSLAPDALDRSRQSLARLGNLSSVSVLLVLGDLLRASPPPDGPSVLFAMGPGFSAELVELLW